MVNEDGDLLGLCLASSKLTLENAEEVLDRVQPRAVLGIEQNGRPHLLADVDDTSVSVDYGVVHQEYYRLLSSSRIAPDMSQNPVDEVLDQCRIECALYHLGAD